MARISAMHVSASLWILILVVGVVVPAQGATVPPDAVCMNQTEYQTQCAMPFQELAKDDNSFWKRVCGGVTWDVFECMKRELDNQCPHDDPAAEEYFIGVFGSFKYSIPLTCECSWTGIPHCLEAYQCGFNINQFSTSTVEGFYEYFCGVANNTLGRSIQCVVSESVRCPEVHNAVLATTVIRTSTQNITFGDINTEVVNRLCPAVVIGEDRECLATRSTACFLDTSIRRGQIQCQYTQMLGKCVNDSCQSVSGPRVANFFNTLFEYLHCGLIYVCPQYQDGNGILWPTTPVGNTAVVNCKPGYIGRLQSTCLQSGASGAWGATSGSCTLITSPPTSPPTTPTPATTESPTTTTTLIETTETTTPTTRDNTTPTPTTTKAPTTTEKPVNLTEALSDLVNLTTAKTNVTETPVEKKIRTTKLVQSLNDVAKGLNSPNQTKPDTIEEPTSQNIIAAVNELLKPENIASLETKEEGEPPEQLAGGTILNVMDSLLETIQPNVCQTLQTGQTKTEVKDNLFVEFGKEPDISFPKSNDLTNGKLEIAAENFQGQDPCFGGTYYANIGSFLTPDNSIAGSDESTERAIVNSGVISMKVDNYKDKIFDPPVIITLKLINTKLQTPVCVFWDSKEKNGKGAWSAVGCFVKEANNETVVCACNHLTNFAVLMSTKRISGAHVKALSIISAVGCALSIICLLLTMLFHWLVWKLVRSDRVIILMNLCVVLLLGLVLFLAGINRTESQSACKAIAALLHFLFLTVFFLMLLTGIEILICLVHVFITKFRIKLLLPISYLISALIVIVSLSVTKAEGYGNEQYCWLDIKEGMIWAFIGPVLFVIFVNCVVIIVVFKKMASTTLLKSKSAKRKLKTSVRSLCVLLPVMGLTWLLGLVSVGDDTPVFAYLFSIFNTLQGVFIFLMHCVFNRQVRNALKHRQRKRVSRASMQTDLRKQSRSQSASADPDSSSPSKRKVSSSENREGDASDRRVSSDKGRRQSQPAVLMGDAPGRRLSSLDMGRRKTQPVL